MRTNIALVLSVAWTAIVLTAFGSRMTHAAGPTRDVRSLSVEEKFQLPAATVVLVGGHSVTLGVLRAYHAAHLFEMNHAAAYGRSAALRISSQHFAITKTGEIVSLHEGQVQRLVPLEITPQGSRFASLNPAERGMFTGVVFKMTGVHISTSPGLLAMPVLMPASILRKYAKDYQDFRQSAEATACLYFPEIGSWEQSNSASNTSIYAITQDIVDPLITDSNVCQAGGGHLTANGCAYTYPVQETTNFSPSASSSTAYIVSCPIDPDAHTWSSSPEWTTVVDPHGAASAQWILGYTWPPWLFPGLQGYHPKVDNPTTCVVQAFAGR